MRRNAPGVSSASPAGQLLDGDAPQVQRHPRRRDGPLDRLAERVHPPHDDLAVAEEEAVAGGHGAGREGAGDDGAGAPDREGPVDPQPDRRVDVGGGQAGQQGLQGARPAPASPRR